MNPYAQETHFVCAKHLRELGGSAPCCVCTRHSDGCSFEGTEEDLKPSEEKKDWEESFNNLFEVARDYNLQFGLIESDIKNFIREKLKEEQDRHEEEMVLFRKHEIADLARARKEEREKWQLKNAGLYRQLFAEMNPDKYITPKEVWEILDSYTPLFTEYQKKELKDNLNSIMK